MASRALFVADPKEGEDIPVSVGDLEAPQTLVYERQFLHERRAPLAELVEERVGVQRVDVRIPTSPFVSAAVRSFTMKNGFIETRFLFAPSGFGPIPILV